MMMDKSECVGEYAWVCVGGCFSAGVHVCGVSVGASVWVCVCGCMYWYVDVGV